MRLYLESVQAHYELSSNNVWPPYVQRVLGSVHENQLFNDISHACKAA